MAVIPDNFLDLLREKKAFANLATLMPDGTPQVTPVWFDYTDGVIRVNTAKGRVKARNMKEGAPVALAIMDPDNAYRYIQVRGQVRRVVEQGADRHIDSLAKKYLGKDKYPFAQPGEVRVMYEIEPRAVNTMS
jgi:PPOX class probable F420-dependent enzyme